MGSATALRDGRVVKILGLSDVETLEFNAMNAMGFFDAKAREIQTGVKIAPRELAARLFREHFHRSHDADEVVIHNVVRGIKDGRTADVVH